MATTNKKDWIVIQNRQYLAYYRNNIVYRGKYQGKVIDYRLYKIDDAHINLNKFALLRDDNLYDVEKVILEIEERANQVHSAFRVLVADLPRGKRITVQQIDDFMLLHTKVAKVKTSSSLIEDFASWINEYNESKRRNLRKEGKSVPSSGILPGTKDFYSCLNLLKDFEYDNYLSSPIQLKDIDDDFLEVLIEYCYNERISNEEHQYLTKGNLVNKTLQKRFDSLFQYLNSVTKGNLPNGISKPHLATEDGIIIRLDTDELRMLCSLKLKEEFEQVIRDYFLFLCYTGLRFADFYKLDKTYFNTQERLLKLKSNKTFSDCEIYLNDSALEIATRYEWNFHRYTNQGLNRGLHDLFEKYDLYGEEIELVYMQNGRKTCKKKKRDLISCHAGRRTFISRLVENGADIYDIMSCTGHKKVETLKYYIDKFGTERKKRLQNMLNTLEV